MNSLPTYTDSPIHPGIHLKETIAELGISQTELAGRIGLSRKVINEIIAGKAPISANTSILLERVLKVPAHFWNNLQNNYDLNIAYLNQQEIIRKDCDLLNYFPVKHMIKYGWIPECKTREEKVKNLYSFFGIARLNNFENAISIHFRRSIKENVSKESIFTWLRRGETKVSNMVTVNYNKKKLKKQLPYLRSLTKTSPDIFQKEIIKTCAKTGVAITFIPELPNTYINGATFWLNSKKAALLLSLRYKTNDHLWFSFFHELGHILLHENKESFVDLEKSLLAPEEQTKEEQANRFAEDILIPPDAWDTFRRKSPFSKEKILSFANEVDIAPGIVVGRLQREHLLPYTHLNSLKLKYQWILPDKK